MDRATELMTLAEASKLLRLRVSTLRAWRLQKRHLPFIQIGRRVFVRRADAEALIAANVQAPMPKTQRVLEVAMLPTSRSDSSVLQQLGG